MKYPFYVLCCVPYKSLFIFENSNDWAWAQTSSQRIGLALFPIEMIILISPVIATIGVFWLLKAINNREPIRPPVIFTLVGVAPGIFLWIEWGLGVL